MTKKTTWVAKYSDYIKSNRQLYIVMTVGFIFGFLWLAGVRFALYSNQETHYHANFGVYINGEREDFDEFTYYEEVAACSADYADNPKGRVHMHERVNDVIHVHDQRVTYGNFFQNIGWSVGNKYLATTTEVYQNTDDKKVTYILNGEKVTTITNKIIGNEDVLLISYGNETTDFDEQYESISRSAEQVNSYQDPASCSGIGDSSDGTFVERLKKATFWQ